jgi:hypothetical protein
MLPFSSRIAHNEKGSISKLFKIVMNYIVPISHSKSNYSDRRGDEIYEPKGSKLAIVAA